jgi:hypothetical protein
MPSSGRRLLRALPVAVAIGLIALLTLEPRPRQAPLSASTPWYCLVCGGLGTVDVLLNLALFVPLGLTLRRLGFGPFRSAMTGLLVSGMVELLQATIVTGRDPSLSDLVTNTLGTVLGSVLGAALPGLVRPTAGRAQSLAEKAAAGWILLLAFTGWAVQPAAAPAQASFRIAPSMPGLDRFPGAISAATFNGSPARGSLDTALVASALASRTLALEATASLLSWTEVLAPIIDIVDRRWVATAQLGQVGQKILFSVRSRSERLRLRAPTVKVYRALPPPRGQTFAAGGRLEGNTLSAFATVGGVTHRAETRLTPGLGWMLVLPLGFYPFDYRPEITSALWTALPLLLVGFWTGQSGARPSVAAGRWAALVCVGLLAIPPLTGAASQGWEAWVACVAALLLGRLAAGYASAGVSATVPPSARSAASP